MISLFVGHCGHHGSDFAPYFENYLVIIDSAAGKMVQSIDTEDLLNLYIFIIEN